MLAHSNSICADLTLNNVGFRTDSSISSGHQVGQRTLQPWNSGGGGSDSDTFGSLGALENKASSSGDKWDQFQANEQLFGLKTDYDENIYTTQIDKSHPKYKERMAAAERKAREIERSAAATSHVAEERIMDYVGGNDRGGDEEDKYSGVKRQDFPPLPGGNRDKKYTPPAMRAPTNNSTVKGAPVDPAIISARIGTQKPQQSPTKVDESKTRTESPAAGTPTNAVPSAKSPEPKADAAKAEPHSKTTEKPLEVKSINQSATPLKASAATSRTISPQGKEGVAVPNATSTVERDVLSSFKNFANKERMTAEKLRSNKAKADKEVKLHELKKFATNFKLPTPVPVDLISIIAKDPAKQREIQEKASRDAAEVAQRRKAEELAAKDKKPTASKEGQPAAAPQGAAQPQPERTRPVSTVVNGPQGGGQGGRHPPNRNYNPQQPYQGYRNDRQGPAHMQQGGRQAGNLAQRIRNVEQHKLADMRQPPTGPSHPNEPPYARRPMAGPGQMGKLNPNSHEFRPNAFAPAFSPNGHPSAGSSPRSALNNTTEGQSTPASSTAAVVVISKKRKAVDPKKCVILSHMKAQPVPQGKNYDDNDGIKPSFDTAPTWRQAQEEEKPESTMRLSYTEYFERQPFAAQPTPNPTHVMPQMPHQHQLPFHLQHGAHNVPTRPSPHIPPVQMHLGQHGPVPHVPYNGADDHRMIHSNSSQSYSSPRMTQVPMAYPPNMNNPQMPYPQPGFAPGTPQMSHFNRSFSNNTQYMPQQQMPMGGPMMPQFMAPQGMPGPQMQMYPSGQFMPPGVSVPQPMPGANGYPSPGRPAAAPMMVHQGSQQGQPIYGMSPGMQYQQPVYPQQPGQMNNMRGYSNPSPQQFGTSPSQMHQYTPQQHRNGNNYKNYQGPNQHQGPQGSHAVPTGPQGRAADGPDEAK
ncbi:hypothetical protein PG994_002295 [Apiospora phragmitis]|uniref:LsmAD domain-containing protein n=1 Tax=Apiospora phragmitis TaxID=2905665 RepID=A0ABR1WVY4_9PEZI